MLNQRRKHNQFIKLIKSIFRNNKYSYRLIRSITQKIAKYHMLSCFILRQKTESCCYGFSFTSTWSPTL